VDASEKGKCPEHRSLFLASLLSSCLVVFLQFIQNALKPSRPGEFGMIDAMELEMMKAPSYRDRKRMSEV